MTTELLDRVFKECVPLVDEVVPFHMGEPLLEKRLLPILEKVKRVNPEARTIIFTNLGTDDLTEHYLKSLLTVTDLLVVSFYAPSPEKYKELQGLDYTTTFENIKRLWRVKQGYGLKTDVKIHYLTMEDTISGYNEWVELVHPYCNGCGLIHYDKFYDFAPYFGCEEKVFGTPKFQRTPCPHLYGSLNINSDGTVVPCCYDYDNILPLGNIKEQSFNEIWLGKPYELLRKAHEARQQDRIPLCKDCDYWKYRHEESWNQVWSTFYLEAKRWK